MAYIRSLEAREILDSRGNPTIEVIASSSSGKVARASVPSGASTGSKEALELRDGDENRFCGKGVLKAVHNVNVTLADLLIGAPLFDQRLLDERMILEDGTQDKSRLGANAILAVSLAVARLAAEELTLPLYRYLGGAYPAHLPLPLMNILNGGAHADNLLEFQEFMIVPHGATTFQEALRWGCEIFHTLKKILVERSLTTAVGDEGGFAPRLETHEEALDLIMEAMERAGFRPEEEISIALDCAASEFYDPENKVYYGKKLRKAARKDGFSRTNEEQIDYLAKLVDRYPIVSIEDPLAEDDWGGWKKMVLRLGERIQIVGDDLLVTNCKLIERAFLERSANAVLIKPNQIGSLTETCDAVELTKRRGWGTIISHRSGETEDTFIADLAVALSARQIKTGSLSRTDRTAKYNRLLVIERDLGDRALFSGAIQRK